MFVQNFPIRHEDIVQKTFLKEIEHKDTNVTLIALTIH